jgi:hypothetical protein
MTATLVAEKPQHEQILEYLQAGNTIDALTALAKFKCFRLASRIFDLRCKGHDIVMSEKVLANGKRIAEYRLNRRS